MTLPRKLLAKIPNNQASRFQWCNDMKVIEETKHSGVQLESCITRGNAMPGTVNLVKSRT